MLKLAILQNIIVPYEVPLFERLSRVPGLQLQVYFCAVTYRERRWGVPARQGFNSEVLRGFTVEIGSLVSSVNPLILWKLIREHPDVLVLSGGYNHITMQLAFLFAKVAGMPIVYRSDQDWISASQATILARIARPLERMMIRSSAAIVCPSARSRRYHVAEGGSPEKVFVVPYTTSDDEVYISESAKLRGQMTDLKNELGLSERRVILFIGRLEQEKGIECLLEAHRMLLAELGDVGLVLMGDGSLLDRYRHICQSKRIHHVYFTGFVSDIDKLRYLSAADVLVLPSVVDPWGLVVNEAMLCSLPVVVSEAAGASEMVTSGENGYVVKKGSSEEIRECLSRLFLDEGLRSSMATKGNEKVRTEYNLQLRAEKFLDAVNFAARRRRRTVDV